MTSSMPPNQPEPDAGQATRPQPSLFWSVLPLIALLVFLIGGYGILGLKTEPLLLLSATVAGLVAWKHGLTFDDMLTGIRQKIDLAMPAILVLISVGILIGSWMLSGTIPMMIYYGLELVNAQYIVLVSFVITAIVSVFTGTSWGSVGSVGVALMGVATGLGASLPATAGAVVAGAYFGDKLSPLSDTTNLAPIAAGTTLWAHIKHMLYTTLPATAVALIVYAIAGFTQGEGQASSAEVDAFSQALATNFDFNILLILPLLVVIVGAAMQLPILPTILGSSIVASILSIVIQKAPLTDVFVVTVDGYNPDMARNAEHLGEAMSNLLTQGGMSSMASVMLLTLCAFAFAGIISAYGALETIIRHLLSFAKRTGDLVLATVVSCFVMAFSTGNSYLSIIIPGELYRDSYVKRGLDPKNLSRTLEDSGTVFVPLVPWSAAGVFMTGVLGVPVLDYLPWAVFCYTGFIFAIVCGYTGFGIAKLEDNEKVGQSA